MSLFASLRLLVVLALRNVLLHRAKSLIVGTILFFGTAIVVTGTAMLDSIQVAMQSSISSSLAGDLQVYDKEAKDELAVYGSMSPTGADIGEIPSFETVERKLETLPGVSAVVPMGAVSAVVFSQNELDEILGNLRTALQAQDAGAVTDLSSRIQAIAKNLEEELKFREAITADRTKLEDDRASLQRVQSPEFWMALAADPETELQYLDTHLAPQAVDGRMYYLRAVGTDLGQFQEAFSRMYIIKGEKVPDGQRGFLLSHRTYEKLLKHKVAIGLDAAKKSIEVDGKTIATDSLLREQIARNAKQYQRILFQLDPKQAAILKEKLLGMLPGQGDDLATLVQAFLTLDDTNFAERYAFFYSDIAPFVRLYDIDVGETITLRAVTKSGYFKSVNVKVYGTFEFKGLETADAISGSNLTDMITFRELYGKMSDAQQAELASIKEQVGVKSVSRESAEDDLFGGGSEATTVATVDASVAESGFDEFAGVDRDGNASTLDQRVYSPEEIRNGLALNAAILVKDPKQIPDILKEVNAVAPDLGLKAVDWIGASGFYGQMVVVVRAVLYTAIFIIFLVALVIINNTMVMATMDRIGEIGTMRAIGAQRRFVLAMFLIETMVLGLISGGAGGLGGVAFVSWLGKVGIPAPVENLVLIFGGPRLYPAVTTGNVLFGLGLIVTVSLLSTFYPALLASRVQPQVAMGGKE